ncbi:hypothetical protein P7C73_g4931, partial [Tremellales sp. Uapishka_1]
MVGLVENALLEIQEKFSPDRIIIESSGSAFPATLALQIRQLEPKGFKLDGILTVIDCVNFRGYEDSSPSAKLQAQYTDLLLLSKHALVSERDYDTLLDHLLTLNDETPYIKVGPENPLDPDLVFGLDTKLFEKTQGEKVDWEALGGQGKHEDEVETRRIWRGGKGGQAKTAHDHVGDGCDCAAEQGEIAGEDVVPIALELLETELSKLSFEVYRVKGIVRLVSDDSKGYTTNVLNFAFGRHELTPIPSLDDDQDLKGVAFKLTMMGERGEVGRRAKKFAAGMNGQVI